MLLLDAEPLDVRAEFDVEELEDLAGNARVITYEFFVVKLISKNWPGLGLHLTSLAMTMKLVQE